MDAGQAIQPEMQVRLSSLTRRLESLTIFLLATNKLFRLSLGRGGAGLIRPQAPPRFFLRSKMVPFRRQTALNR